MNKYIKTILLLAFAFIALPVSAQISRISGTVSDEFGGIPGIQVKEVDTNNRIVSSTVTDANGNFTMSVKNSKNKLVFHGMGYTDKTMPINKAVYKVNMNEATKQMKEVQVVGKKKAATTGLDIPAREYAGAVSTMKMDDLEGLAFESVDQALQGQIAGLDIVANSGNLGSGTTMRLRGTSTFNGNAQPLIVVNDHIFELPDDAQEVNFEDMDNEEQFSTLLNVNPEDIESIAVLKDAASAAKWGAKGSNGVIEIKLRRGKRGPTQVNFSYKFTGRWQPDGYKMLNGDGYTMLLKEAYFNPYQKSTYADEMAELNYNMEMPYIYNHFNHNTDWVDAVKQFGKEHRYYINLSGGGEKAQFRIGAGYNKSAGSIIGQKMDQFTESTTLDYQVSDRIQFRATVNMTFTSNHRNNSDILAGAYNAMPNMSIYEYDAQGNLTGNYFNMFPMSATLTTSSTTQISPQQDGTTSYYLQDMFKNGNPVANAMLAWNKKKQYNLTPQFDVTYKLWGKDGDHHQLNYQGDVQLDIYNTSDDHYTPSELRTMPWVFGGDNAAALTSNGRNEVGNSEYKSLGFSTRHSLLYYSHFKNTDHSLSGIARFEMYTGSSSSQNLSLWNVPDGITDPTVVALLQGASAGNSEWRSHSFYEQLHYSYKSKYSLDVNVRTDGSTAFGSNHKYGTFPAFGARWNISDEEWMEKTKSVISMSAFRPTWGITGNSGKGGGNQYNKYSSNGYYNGHSVVTPDNLSLINLRWEKTAAWNLGFNLGLLNDLLNFEFEVYNRKTTDLIMYGKRISSANGYSSLSCVNAGEMRNKGWELNFNTGKFAKVGKFSMRLRGNISQNFNTVMDMDPLILEGLNGSETWNPTNLSYNQRVQVGNALGSIYGLKYNGVFRYDYDHNGYTTSSFKSYGYAEVDENNNVCPNADYAAIHGTGYDAAGNPINTAAAALRRNENSTCPIAYDGNGNMLTDAKGNPLPLYYCYSESSRYQFQGGDAIYEDINHDGSIDRYDMVYLGNSNPKCYGGFGVNLYYGKFELNASFNFRMGNQIVNLARGYYESMTANTNQSYATTWRWRKNGDITEIPRALSSAYGYSSYNSLPSDRYVENGNYLRLQYIQMKYNFDAKKLKKYGIRSLYVSATINNIFCWTKYTGVDPEVSIGGYGVATDGQKTPPAKSFTASVNLGF